jgi:hypothetical protein
LVMAKVGCSFRDTGKCKYPPPPSDKDRNYLFQHLG